MRIYFIDTSKKFELIQNIGITNITENKKILSGFEEDVDIINNDKENYLEIEQLQTNVLNSLNYASNQKLLPSTLPEKLNLSMYLN